MIVFRSYLEEDKQLVAIEQATKTPPDDVYIEGAIEMLVDGQPVLRREAADLVDQLWAYLIRGLEELMAGHDFTTYYPDMPLKVEMQSQGNQVLITADDREKVNSATVELEELKQAMLPAATTFFARLRELSPVHGNICKKYLERIEQLR